MSSGKRFLNLGTETPIKQLVFLAAPVIAVLIAIFGDLDPGNPKVTYTLAIAVLMALWWVTEVVPLAITSLLPIVLFPVFGVMNGKAVSSTYFNHVIFLFIGGFLVALALQRWNLHKRIALRILRITGTSPGRILFGFMFATAFLSMWISNTATTMMMVPILISILSKLEDLNGEEKVKHFGVGILLGIAYAASIGGIATLVGTPPNLSFVRIFNIYFPNAPEISFATWFFFAFPVSVIMFIFIYSYLYLIFVKRKSGWKSITSNTLNNEIKKLGKTSYEEKVLLVAFVSLALLWFFRSNINIGSLTIPGWSNLFHHPKFLNDGTVAIFVAIILFLIPSKSEKGKMLLDWKTAEDIPWEIILLFGGGFALANGFKESGLSAWFGEQLVWLKDVPTIIIIASITTLVTFLPELTSNTATVETILPVLAGLALSIGVNPLLFMVPATVAGSLAFMLPVATPPNAIIFGTKRLSVLQMSKTGFFLNLIGIVVVSIITYYLGSLIFEIQVGVLPPWAK